MDRSNASDLNGVGSELVLNEIRTAGMRTGTVQSSRFTIMAFPAPALEGFIVVVQHKPEIARRLEAALAHAGATVFVARQVWEAVQLHKKFDAQLVVFDSHDADGELNEPIVIDARLMANVGAIRYSGEIADLPDMMSFGTWIDIARPVADVVELAIEWRRLLKA
ncbi:hypothetical protein [Rhizobium sp. S163]|uniref:hypothetical protein n=1 Tax=Rhizobium sp. S163 TaxID=3055039 RepID=UPI0025A9EB89|nr:hypothetical protein [Rhizobium sp. S163]MDM9644832.1 hypothetical protein [Rhizobium sp. S163]